MNKDKRVPLNFYVSLELRRWVKVLAAQSDVEVGQIMRALMSEMQANEKLAARVVKSAPYE